MALSLSERQANRVDPFKQGFGHGADELDLMSVRLCFQASGVPGQSENHLFITSSSYER